MRSDSKRFRRAGVIVAISALCAACAAGGYDAGAVRRHLVEAGLSPRAADCVVLHMGPRFGDEQLGVRADPTAAEIAAERKLMRTCGVKLASP